MKTILLVVCCVIITLIFRQAKTEPDGTANPAIASAVIDTLSFKTDIQPILQKNCSPCHFEGGKMYIRMPFDKGETIVTHASGALKRFGDKKENALIKQYIEQHKSD